MLTRRVRGEGEQEGKRGMLAWRGGVRALRERMSKTDPGRTRTAGRPPCGLPFLAAALLLPATCRAGEIPPTPQAPGAPTVEDQQTQQSTARAAGPPLGKAWVVFGTDTVLAEVPTTPEARERGLMYRTELAEGAGMLFLYPEEEIFSFWMSNTYLPLDVAFLDAMLRVVDIQQMEPETTDLHTSAAPAMFGLEVPQGWFAAHGVMVGDRAQLVLGPP